MDYSEPAEVLTLVRGVHEVDMENGKVEGLYFEGQSVAQIPRDISEIFPNIKALQFYDSGLLSISADDLMQFPGLLVWSSYYNQLETLESDLFVNNQNIQQIEFSNENLQHVGEDLFSNLSNLQSAKFQHCNCVNEIAESQQEISNLNFRLSLMCPMPTVPSKRLFFVNLLSPTGNINYFIVLSNWKCDHRIQYSPGFKYPLPL